LDGKKKKKKKKKKNQLLQNKECERKQKFENNHILQIFKFIKSFFQERKRFLTKYQLIFQKYGLFYEQFIFHKKKNRNWGKKLSQKYFKSTKINRVDIIAIKDAAAKQV